MLRCQAPKPPAVLGDSCFASDTFRRRKEQVFNLNYKRSDEAGHWYQWCKYYANLGAEALKRLEKATGPNQEKRKLEQLQSQFEQERARAEEKQDEIFRLKKKIIALEKSVVFLQTEPSTIPPPPSQQLTIMTSTSSCCSISIPPSDGDLVVLPKTTAEVLRSDASAPAAQDVFPLKSALEQLHRENQQLHRDNQRLQSDNQQFQRASLILQGKLGQLQELNYHLQTRLLRAPSHLPAPPSAPCHSPTPPSHPPAAAPAPAAAPSHSSPVHSYPPTPSRKPAPPPSYHPAAPSRSPAPPPSQLPFNPHDETRQRSTKEPPHQVHPAEIQTPAVPHQHHQHHLAPTGRQQQQPHHNHRPPVCIICGEAYSGGPFFDKAWLYDHSVLTGHHFQAAVGQHLFNQTETTRKRNYDQAF